MPIFYQKVQATKTGFQIYNDYMNNLQKIRAIFVQHGYTPTTSLRRMEFQNFLNSLVSGDGFPMDVAEQLWEQSTSGGDASTAEELAKTIFEAQNIIQSKIIQLSGDIKVMQEELRHNMSPQDSRRGDQLRQEIEDREDEKRSFENDLLMLTEPFGINMLAFMAQAQQSSRVGYGQPQPDYTNTTGVTEQVQLKWLFYLCVMFGVIELIVIYQKYDFLNLMVFSCLMLIFFMNQLDSTYMKFTLGLVIVSEILDVVWLFMNSGSYWNLPAVGPISSGMGGYMKIIIILTFLGLFIKIPLGVFLFHYRNLDTSKEYILDLPCLKMQLTPNKTNPISQAIRNISIAQ